MGWFDDLINKLSGGAFSIASLLNISGGSLVTEKDKFITSAGITKVIQVTEMPHIYSKNFVQEITKYVAGVDPNILVKVYMEADPVTIPVGHVSFVNKANNALKKYIELDTLYQNLPPAIKASGVYHNNGMRTRSFTREDVMKAKATSDSFNEVRNHIKRDGGVYFLCRIFVHLTFKDQDSLNANFSTIAAFIGSEAANTVVVNKKMATYLMNMSPSATNIQGIPSSTVLVSQESLTNLLPYRAEGLLSTKGTLMGTNVKTDTPFFLDSYSNPDGTSVLIHADSGSGKTSFATHFSLQRMGSGVSTVYLDIKGTGVTAAYSQLIDEYQTIAFFGKGAKFINMLFLNSNNPDYTVEEAVDTTANWLAIMVKLKESEGNHQDLINILKAAIRGYYASLNISDANIASYDLSYQMELGKVVEFLGTNRNESTSSLEMDLYEVTAKRISSILNDYNMSRNDNALDISTLFDVNSLIFDFNKSKDVVLTLIDEVRLYTAIFYTQQLLSFNKRNGSYTELVADEGNQYKALPGLMQFISKFASAARSENGSVVFITNDLSVVTQPEMSGFASNIAVYVIGKSKERDLSSLESLGAPDELLANIKSLNKNPGKYKRCFAVYSAVGGDARHAIVRADMPKEVVDKLSTKTVSKAAI